MNTLAIETLEQQKYKVVKIMRESGRRNILCKNLSESEAQRIVKSFPDSIRSMVVYFKQ
jgi:hypothetical protein